VEASDGDRASAGGELGRLLILLALLGTAGYLWWARDVPPESPAPAPVPAAAPAATRPASPLLALPPEQMREGLHAAYRLQPDRRCLAAFTEVQAWFGGHDPLPVSATFERGAWRIEIAGGGVGTLPELPDFGDCMKALERWAVVVGKGKGAAPGGGDAPAPGPERLNPADLLADLRAADGKASHTADSRELARIGRDLVYLTLQSLDLLEMTDRLRAKAWAFLAMSAALTGADLRRETALLAYLLDYSESARRLAEALPAADPVRAFVLRDERALAALAEASGDELSALLVLVRRAEDHDYPGWLAWVQAHFIERPFSLPVLKSALELNAFLPNRIFPEVMPYLVLAHLFRDTADTSWTRKVRQLDLYTGSDDTVGVIAALIGRALRVQAGDLVLRFEGELDLAGGHYPGPVLDADTYAAFYAGYLYSALWASAEFRLDQLASLPAAEEFARALPDADMPRPAAFARWYRDRIDARAGKADLSLLLADLSLPAPFGARPRFRTFDALDPYIGAWGPERFEAVRRMAGAMDSRPVHVAWLARTAERHLDDLNLAERLYRHLLRVAERRLPGDAVWSAYLFGDTARLERYVADPTLSLDSRRRALGYVASLRGRKDASVEGLYRSLLRDFPDSWPLTEDLVGYLEWREQYARARAAAEAWLARDVPQAGLEGVSAETAIARAYYEEGRYAEAWEAIKPALPSWQSGALVRAALIRDRLGDPRHAEALFLLDMDRYPDLLWTRTLYVRFLWEHGRYKDAADTLRAFKGPLEPQAWLDDIRVRFHEAFEKAPDEEALQAFEALVKGGLPRRGLGYLWDPFELQGRRELAFRMSSSLTERSVMGVEFQTASYQILKRWKGEAEALAWLRARLPRGLQNQASMVFFDRGEDGLLWDAIERPEDGEGPEWVWLVRALAALRRGPTDRARREALTRYFGTPRPDGADVLGNFLLGKASERDVWQRATDARTRAQGAYAVGLRRLCEGRYREASDWFRVTQELGPEQVGEYRWATSQLRGWRAQQKSLDRIAPRCGTPPRVGGGRTPRARLAVGARVS